MFHPSDTSPSVLPALCGTGFPLPLTSPLGATYRVGSSDRSIFVDGPSGWPETPDLSPMIMNSTRYQSLRVASHTTGFLTLEDGE